jgi:hypothetical protein
MGAGFFQDLANQGATQNATQAPQYTMPTYQGGGYTTTKGDNFNYTTPNAPYAGMYTEPLNINPTNTALKPVQNKPTYSMFGMPITFANEPKNDSQSSFDNPSALPNYAMYIPPSQMPDINAYLQNPNSLLGAMQDAGVPITGAGKYSNLLSTNTKGK